jgi:tripartite-type tricarboxylate transporter receptor subunit TctC
MKRLLFALAACLAFVLAQAQTPSTGSAQAYPSRPVRIVVPFAPGGPADLLGRLAGQAITDGLGQPAVVDNRVGAAGNIGVDLIAKAMPDGYTLGIVPVGNIAVNPSLFPNLPYKASELAPVSLLATVENVLVVHASLPATSLASLLALARQKPDSLSFASAGAGSQAHLAGELMALDGKVSLVHVPYKGTGPALNDLVGGQVSMMFAQASSAVPFIQQGKLRPIGVASLKRSSVLPQVPTVAEQGMGGFEAVSWYALMAPAGTPKDIVDRLHAEMAKLLARPDTREKFAALGMEPGMGTPEQLATRITQETARWSDVVRKRSIKAD